MSKLMCMTKRNFLVFIRDRSSVFFALLSTMIVLLLMGIFLGNMNVETITDLLTQYGGAARDTALDKQNASELVQYWTLAGILIVNAVSVTLSAISVMVDDSGNNRIESFYSSPIKRPVIALSYIFSAIIIGTLFDIVTLLIGEVYIWANGGQLLSLVANCEVLVFIVLNVAMYSIIMYMIAMLAKTSGAWGGIGTVFGTLVGFVGAIYFPIGSLPRSVGRVLKCLPVLHGTSILRKICCADVIDRTFSGMPSEFISEYNKHMGINVVVNSKILSSSFQIGFLITYAVIALLIAILITVKKNVNDR